MSRLYDLEKLFDLAAGDEKFVKKMVGMFTNMVPEFISRIENSLEHGDLHDVGDAAHKIKPSIDTMGIQSLYQPIRDLESEGRSGNEAAVRQLIASVSTELRIVCQQLDSL